MNELSANPFGVIDHSAFAGFGVDLVWGLEEDGEAIHVTAARRGLACELVCPACKARLIARKGSKKAPHFAHHKGASECGSGRETNAHFWAKQLLMAHKRIWTPIVTATVDGVSRVESKARWMTFSDVRSERRLEQIVPDIVLILADGRELIVEICVTHACGEDKIALIQANGWPAIEIDLSRFRTSQDIEAIKRALLQDAPRSWLCNPRRDRAEERLRSDLAAAAVEREAVAQRRAAEEAEHRRRELAEIEAAAKGLLHAAAEALRQCRPITDPTLARLVADDGGERIGLSAAGSGFLVTRDEWQATLLDRFVMIRDPRTFEDQTFSLSDALAYLEPLIAPEFGSPPPAPIRTWLRSHRPDLRFPYEAVEDYCDALCAAGWLQMESDGDYGLADDIVSELKRERRRLLDIDARADIAYNIVDAILADIPPDEVYDFEPQLWLATDVASLGQTPGAMVASGGALFEDLIERLRNLAAMARGGAEVIDDLLGLPLTGARFRAIERKATREASEAAERAQTLRDAATSALGSDASAWLAMPFEGGVETPLVLARDGCTGLQLCLAAIARLHREREVARAEAAAMIARRDQLQTAIARLYPPPLRDLALRNQLPGLDCSPWDACTSDHGLERAIRLLTRQVEGRRRRR